MQAYHTRTREPSPYDHLLGEHFTLDCLLIPEADIMIGFVPSCSDKRKGSILSYPYPSIYATRLMRIVRGTDRSVKGDFIGEIDLSEDIAREIQRNYYPVLKNWEKTYHITKDIKLAWDYESTTPELVTILSHTPEIKQKPGGGKRARKWNWPRIRIPVIAPGGPELVPEPSF